MVWSLIHEDHPTKERFVEYLQWFDVQEPDTLWGETKYLPEALRMQTFSFSAPLGTLTLTLSCLRLSIQNPCYIRHLLRQMRICDFYYYVYPKDNMEEALTSVFSDAELMMLHLIDKESTTTIREYLGTGNNNDYTEETELMM